MSASITEGFALLIVAGLMLSEPSWSTAPQIDDWQSHCRDRVEVTYYHPSLAGAPMANGTSYDPRNPLLAASNRYRLGTLLQIARPDGTAPTIVQVADRGGDGFDLDLSEAAFRRLAPLDVGRVTACVDRIIIGG